MTTNFWASAIYAGDPPECGITVNGTIDLSIGVESAAFGPSARRPATGLALELLLSPDRSGSSDPGTTKSVQPYSTTVSLDDPAANGPITIWYKDLNVATFTPVASAAPNPFQPPKAGGGGAAPPKARPRKGAGRPV